MSNISLNKCNKNLFINNEVSIDYFQVLCKAKKSCFSSDEADFEDVVNSIKEIVYCLTIKNKETSENYLRYKNAATFVAKIGLSYDDWHEKSNIRIESLIYKSIADERICAINTKIRVLFEKRLSNGCYVKYLCRDFKEIPKDFNIEKAISDLVSLYFTPGTKPVAKFYLAKLRIILLTELKPGMEKSLKRIICKTMVQDFLCKRKTIWFNIEVLKKVLFDNRFRQISSLLKRGRFCINNSNKTGFTMMSYSARTIEETISFLARSLGAATTKYDDCYIYSLMMSVECGFCYDSFNNRNEEEIKGMFFKRIIESSDKEIHPEVKQKMMATVGNTINLTKSPSEKFMGFDEKENSIRTTVRNFAEEIKVSSNLNEDKNFDNKKHAIIKSIVKELDLSYLLEGKYDVREIQSEIWTAISDQIYSTKEPRFGEAVFKAIRQMTPYKVLDRFIRLGEELHFTYPYPGGIICTKSDEKYDNEKEIDGVVHYVNDILKNFPKYSSVYAPVLLFVKEIIDLQIQRYRIRDGTS